MTGELIRWLLTGLISILMVLNWFWIKRWINQQDEKWKKHDETRELERQEWFRAGGLVTREMYYAWCEAQMSKCPTCIGYKNLTDWRNSIMDKGGPLLKSEHTLLCKEIVGEVTEKFCSRLDELLQYHREWVGQELKLLRLQVTKVLDNGNRKDL